MNEWIPTREEAIVDVYKDNCNHYVRTCGGAFFNALAGSDVSDGQRVTNYLVRFVMYVMSSKLITAAHLMQRKSWCCGEDVEASNRDI